MNWECHIQDICKKIASALGAIKRIRHLIPFNILINVYDSLVQPYFNYCSVVWGNYSSGLSEKLQKLQNHAACILMCANYDYDIDELFRVLGWRKLRYQRFESAAVMMCKSLHGMTPEYPSSRFVFRNDIISYRILKINWLFRSPTPIIWKRFFLTAETGCVTAYLVTFVQQHLYMIFKLNIRHHSFEWVLTRHPCKAAFSM